MLARKRQELILDKVRTPGEARVSELVQHLSVSDMTVRRNIEALVGRGLVTRMHGGATAPGSSVDKPSYKAETNRALIRSAHHVSVVANNSNSGWWG
jgi:DeoR/GlpR family transcriptional regulator of sugar metabolism